ncbi:MAG: glutamyl-tRNA reductase [Desulfatiglandaceae bacterium]
MNIGMNHETAPVSLRERLAVEAGSGTSAQAVLRECSAVKEALFISTCNRVEAVAVAENPGRAEEALLSVMAETGGISSDELSGFIYRLVDGDAVKHIFMVASSLDSMIVGEPQILGQIKKAYTCAVAGKTSGVVLNRLMHRAFHVAKRVRTETGVCEAAVSVGYAAVEMAKKIFNRLEGKKVLLIGAGEMAELAARHLMGQGAGSLVVANRTFDRAREVARCFNAVAVDLNEIEYQLLDADIIITSTGSPGHILTYSQLKKSLRKRRNRPLFIIDIAVPRDVDPEINRLDNVYVYDIDDLKGVITLNVAQRRQESLKAERIVVEEVAKFEKWLETLHVVPTIAALRKKAASLVATELKRSRSSLNDLSPKQLSAVQTLVNSVAEKIINDPILFLKNKAESSTRDRYLDVARRLFRLDNDIISGGHQKTKDTGGSEKATGNSEEPLWMSKR